MTEHIHWIDLGVMTSIDEEAEQLNQILDYIEKYPSTEVEVYTFDMGSFDVILRLSCNQKYQDLELDVNSDSSLLKRRTKKPSNITKWISFKEFILKRYYVHSRLNSNFRRTLRGGYDKMRKLRVNGITRGQYKQNCPNSWNKCTRKYNPEYHLDYKIRRSVDLGKVTYTYSNGCMIVRYFNNNFLIDDDEIMTMWVDNTRDMFYVPEIKKKLYDEEFLDE